MERESYLASPKFAWRFGRSRSQGAVRARRWCRIPFADLLRQHSESAIGPRHRTAAGDDAASRARRRTMAAR